MKKIFLNNRVVAIAFLTLFSFTAGTVHANDKDSSVPVELKYVGDIQNKPLFLLNFNGNAEQNDFVIRITDEFGNSLYRENIKAEVFSKKYLINTDEIGENYIRFEITCRRTNKTVTYEINRQTRQLQNMVINELR